MPEDMPSVRFRRFTACLIGSAWLLFFLHLFLPVVEDEVLSSERLLASLETNIRLDEPGMTAVAKPDILDGHAVSWQRLHHLTSGSMDSSALYRFSLLVWSLCTAVMLLSWLPLVFRNRGMRMALLTGAALGAIWTWSSPWILPLFSGTAGIQFHAGHWVLALAFSHLAIGLAMEHLAPRAQTLSRLLRRSAALHWDQVPAEKRSPTQPQTPSTVSGIHLW